MKCTYLGKKPVHFQNQVGVEIKGTTIFYAFAEDGVDGYAATKAFVKENQSLPELSPLDEVEISFNQRGKIVSISKPIAPIAKPIQKP